MIKRSIGVVALLGFNLLANGDVGEDVLRCRGVEDNRERLTCYDRIAHSIEESVPVSDLRREEPIESISAPQPELDAPVVEVVEPTRAEPVTKVEPDTIPEQPVAEVTRAEPVAEPKRDTPAGEADRATFGNEQIRTEAERAKGITAKIVSVQKLSRGTHLLTMDDGQVWQEIEYDVKTRYGPGDEVVIKRAFFGSYILISQTTGHANKVRRVK